LDFSGRMITVTVLYTDILNSSHMYESGDAAFTILTTIWAACTEVAKSNNEAMFIQCRPLEI